MEMKPRSGSIPGDRGRCSPLRSKGGYDAAVKLVDSLKLFSHVANP